MLLLPIGFRQQPSGGGGGDFTCITDHPTLKDDILCYLKMENNTDEKSYMTWVDFQYIPTEGVIDNGITSNSWIRSNYELLNFGDESFTSSAWVKLNQDSSNTFIISKWAVGFGGELGYLLSYDVAADRFKFEVSSNGSGVAATLLANGFGEASTGIWYHVIFWHDSVNNILGISVNGVTDTQAFSTGIKQNNETRVVLGGLNGNFGSVTATQPTSIDEWGVWSKALTSQERIDLYNAGAGLPYD